MKEFSMFGIQAIDIIFFKVYFAGNFSFFVVCIIRTVRAKETYK